ncbi:hypothetical protein BJ928_105266 [Rhizobium sp. WW_1]|nr:hypothetical protein BJ928_105266 [Rhizobium sp. WW_1]
MWPSASLLSSKEARIVQSAVGVVFAFGSALLLQAARADMHWRHFKRAV